MSNFAYTHFVNTHKAHQSHDSYKAVLESVRLFCATHRYTLPDTCFKILDLVAGYSKHVLGVSWLEFEKIIEKLEISRRTFERCMKLLVENSIIEKHREKHKLGGRRSFLVIKQFGIDSEIESSVDDPSASGDVSFDNLAALIDASNDVLPTKQKTPAEPYIANDLSNHQEPCNKSSNLALKDSFYSSTKLNQETNISNVKQSQFSQVESIVSGMIQRKKMESIPEYFHKAIKTNMDDEMLLTLWDRTVICKRECGLKYIVTDIVTEAWDITFKKTKQHKNESGDMIGLYYGVLRELTEALRADCYFNGNFDEYFYPKKGKKGSIFLDFKPFVTKAMKKQINNLMNLRNYTYEEALKICLKR